MNRIAVVGGINQDIVIHVPRIPQPGETVHHGRLGRYAGGKGANQAVAAARAGAAVSMLGAVGTDAAGDDLLRGMAANGVDTTHVARTESAATGTALIAVDAAGANSIAVAEGANFAIDPAAVRAAVADLHPVAVIGQREVPDAVTQAAFRASPAGLRVLNVSPVDHDMAIDLSLVDIAVVNEIEAAQLLDILSAATASSPLPMETFAEPGQGLRIACAPGKLPGSATPDSRLRGNDGGVMQRSPLGEGRVRVPSSTAALAAALAEHTHRGCVVTLGGQGLVAHIDGQTHVQPAFPTTVVDTTGAGDAFCGVFTAALASGQSVESALRWGQAAGALAAATPGAQPSMPKADDIRRLAQTELV